MRVPATSAPVERVFSHGGLFMRPHRAHLGQKLLPNLYLQNVTSTLCRYGMRKLNFVCSELLIEVIQGELKQSGTPINFVIFLRPFGQNVQNLQHVLQDQFHIISENFIKFGSQMAELCAFL